MNFIARSQMAAVAGWLAQGPACFADVGEPGDSDNYIEDLSC